MPVITTYKGKGLVDEHGDGALGAAGLSPIADKILLDIAAQADLILLAGYDPIEMRAGWLDALGDGERIIEISALPADHAMHQAGLRINAPVGKALDALLAGLDAQPRWPGGEPQRARAALDAAFSARDEWGPHAVFAELNAAMPGDGIVTVDSGAHRILLSQMWKARQPLTMLQSTAWCTMGSAIPLAIGAKTAAPARRVVAVLGDGGLEMSMGELGTLRDAGLSVTLVVLQDRSLGLIELKQAQAGLALHGVRMGATDYAAVARAFGGHGESVAGRAEFSRALEQAAARPQFTLIACQTDAAQYAGRF